MNEFVFQLAGFMCLKESTLWRWSHARHHTDTIIVGRDREIAAMRPPNVTALLLNLLALAMAWSYAQSLLRHAAGRMNAKEADFIPRSEWRKVFREARVHLVLHGGVVVLAIAVGSWIPVLLVGFGPSIYGGWLLHVLSLTQHAGLDEDVSIIV
jgi:fatty acid desaturase